MQDVEPMAEYITKEAAIEAFENGEADVIEDYGDGADFGFGLKNIKSTINTIPAADVVPVVRCKDCKYYKPNEYECGCEFAGGLPYVKADDYCSYGERKETDHGEENE